MAEPYLGPDREMTWSWHKVIFKYNYDDESDDRFHAACLWCDDPELPGEWAEWTYGTEIEFRFTDPDVAFAFKMRWG